MKSIPVVRESYEPRYNVKSAYGMLNESNFISAQLSLKTTRPTIRLDNFIQIKKVSCPEGMVIEFDNTENAQAAYDAWLIPNLAFILGHEQDCGDEVGTFGVLAMSVRDQYLDVDVEILPREDVVQDWDIAITQQPVMMQPNPRLFKRAYDYSRNFTVSLDFNPGEALKSIHDPFFWFLGCQFFQCIECYTLGHATLQVHFKGHGLVLQEYKMRLEGEFKANMNLKIAAFPTDEQYIYWDYLAIIPLSPLIIPGLYSFGPEFRVMGAIVSYADTELSADVGFDVYFPFDIELASKNFSTPPEMRNRHKASFSYHQMNITKFNPRPTYIGGHLMLAPEVGLSLRIATRRVVDVAARLVNQIGFVHRYGNLTKCRDEKPHTEVFHRHKIQSTFSPHIYSGFIFTQYDSEKIAFKCFNCNTCLADNLNSTSLHDRKFNNLTMALDRVSDKAVFAKWNKKIM